MSSLLHLAEATDLVAIVTIRNAAFRGASARQTGSIESGYVTGTRTDESLLREEIAGGTQFLLAKEFGTSTIQGCVSLQSLSPERWYVGSIAVDPVFQNTGLGRKLLHGAEEYATAHGARVIEITVVSARNAHISWYERRGYRLTGEIRPFPYGNSRFGTPTRTDLEFVVLVKEMLREQRD